MTDQEYATDQATLESHDRSPAQPTLTEQRFAAWTAVSRTPPEGLAELSGATDPWAQWARGVIDTARGDYATAFTGLLPLTARADEVGGLARTRIAAVLRQLDEHAAARPFDEQALQSSGQAPIDALVGLAADAVGLADLEAAGSWLGQARDRAGSLRDRVRIAWVATEIDLCCNDWAQARRSARLAAEMAVAMGSPRHQVKSALFVGVTERHCDPGTAIETLHRGYATAADLRLRPLLWPLVEVLGDAATPQQRSAAAAAVRHLQAALPPGGVGAAWSRRAPDFGQ